MIKGLAATVVSFSCAMILLTTCTIAAKVLGRK